MFVARSVQQGFSIFSIVLLFSLSGCIGGGGGQVQFGGAEFFLAATDFITPKTTSATDMMAAILPLHGHTDIPPIADKFGWQHYLTYKDRGLLSEQYTERLFDISDSPKEITYLLDMSDTAQNSLRPGWRFRYRGAADRHIFPQNSAWNGNIIRRAN